MNINRKEIRAQYNIHADKNLLSEDVQIARLSSIPGVNWHNLQSFSRCIARVQTLPVLCPVRTFYNLQMVKLGQTHHSS